MSRGRKNEEALSFSLSLSLSHTHIHIYISTARVPFSSHPHGYHSYRPSMLATANAAAAPLWSSGHSRISAFVPDISRATVASCCEGNRPEKSRTGWVRGSMADSDRDVPVFQFSSKAESTKQERERKKTSQKFCCLHVNSTAFTVFRDRNANLETALHAPGAVPMFFAPLQTVGFGKHVRLRGFQRARSRPSD